MVQFADLWRGHPTNESVDAPCLSNGGTAGEWGADGPPEPVPAGMPLYDNQSAIRVGVALRRAGVRIEDLGPKIKTCTAHERSALHILYPRQLADTLRRVELAGFGEMEIITGADVERFHTRLLGRTGVLYVRDYWMRPVDRDGLPTGDVIDLWNGYRTTESWLMEWMAWAGYRSPYALAREIWFWPVA